MAAISSKEAAAYLIDPLTAPEPSAETGPGTHFTRDDSPARPRSHLSTNDDRSGSSKNPYRGSMTKPGGHSRNVSNASNRSNRSDGVPSYVTSGDTSPNRPRGASLRERFPGDNSHKPLDIIRRDSQKANRSPHLRKRNLPGADTIDRLDPAIGSAPYHHEGPYDAALLARNREPGQGPIGALRTSNAEALRATPVENVNNSLHRHVPLEGTAQVPPGEEDRFGRTYDYQEGENMMIANDPPGGPYKRWSGVEYHPDDLEGRGGPDYTREASTKDHSAPVDRANVGATELTERNHDRKVQPNVHEVEAETAGEASGHNRSGSLKDGLKKRIGSLRRKNRDE